jgi:hypothetical protein
MKYHLLSLYLKNIQFKKGTYIESFNKDSILPKITPLIAKHTSKNIRKILQVFR